MDQDVASRDASEAEQTHTSRALEIILWTLMSAAVLLSATTFLAPYLLVRWLLIVFVVFALCVPTHILNRRGYTRVASLTLTLGLFLIITAVVITGGGIGSLAASAYLIIVFVAALLLGTRAGIAAALLCILTAFGLVIMESAGYLLSRSAPHSPLTRWASLTLLVVVMMSLQHLAARTIKNALRQSRKALEGRERAEMALRLSEERYRKMAENFPNGAVMLFDRDLRYLLGDGSELAVAGLAKEMLEGKTIWEVFPPETCTMIEPLYRAALSGETRVSEVPFAGRIYEVYVLPIRNDQNEVVSGMVMTQNITGRKEAERRAGELAQFLNKTRETVIVSDMNDRFIYWNKGAEQLLGWTAAEAVGKTAAEVFPDDPEEPLATIRQTVLEKGEWHGELVSSHRDGRVFPAESSWTLVRDADGRPEAMISISSDISERRQIEESLRANEELLRQFIKHTPAAIAMFDTEMVYLQVSDRFLTDYHLEGRDIIGKWHYEVFPDLPERWKETHRRILAGAVERCDEDPYIGPDGATEWLQWESLPWRKAGGEIGGLILFTQVITERKRAEEALRASEERFARILNLSPYRMGIMRRADGVILYVNDCWVRETGFSREETINRSVFEMSTWLDDEMQDRVRRILEIGEPISGWETRVRTKSGEVRVALTSAEAVVIDGEECFLWAANDITERKRVEEALHLSEDRYRRIVEAAPEAIVVVDIATRKFVDFNPAALALFKISASDILKVGPADLSPRFQRGDLESTVAAMSYLKRALAGETPVFEWIHRNTRGEEIPCEVRLLQLPDESSLLVRGTITDITERKLAETSLRASEEQLRALSARIQWAREDEGARIAREIHDELGGALTGLKWDLEKIDKTLSKSSNGAGVAAVRQRIGTMTGLIESTINVVRRISSELRPGVLDDLGLVAAIEWQVQQFQNRTGLNCHWDTTLDGVDLERESATAVFRIFQEILTNVLRHSHASNIYVLLRQSASQIELQVRDDGRGIKEKEKENTRSLGILGMKERALLVGGEVNIVGAEGEGTTVIVRVPLRTQPRSNYSAS